MARGDKRFCMEIKSGRIHRINSLLHIIHDMCVMKSLEVCEL